jgi:carbamate kinase
VITQVFVDETDPAFQHPIKPSGPFLSKEEAEPRARDMTWDVVDDLGRGWRRVVASPSPMRVIQHRRIREASQQGHIVVACGGGGKRGRITDPRHLLDALNGKAGTHFAGRR